MPCTHTFHAYIYIYIYMHRKLVLPKTHALPNGNTTDNTLIEM